MSAFERLGNCVFAFFGGFAAGFGVGACALALGQFFAYLDGNGSFRARERLFIGIDGDEFHTLYAALHHTVHSVAAAATDADDFDIDNIVETAFHLKSHIRRPPFMFSLQILQYKLKKS